MKITRHSHRDLKLYNALFYILFFAVVLLLGYVSKTYKFEADWTAGNRNTLTETTQNILAKLDKPLKFIAYIPDDPALQEELKLLVDKYKRFKADTSLEIVNPDLQPAKAKNAGVTYTGQVILHLGDKQESVEAIDEQTIVQTLYRLSREKQRVITFLSGHNERNPFSPQSTGISSLSDVLSRQGFEVQSHNLISTQAIPNNTDILVIAAPQTAYLEGEIKIIQAYIKAGGKLLWLHDPDSSDSLTPLADQLGILVHTGTIVDANQELQQLLGIRNAAVIPVIDYTRSSITKGIDRQTLFPFSTMIEEDFDAKIKADMLWQYNAFLNTMPTSWLEKGDINSSTLIFEVEKDDRQGPIPLGLSLSKVKDDAQQRIIVMGDSDFLLNSFIGYGANLDLARNIFNWLGQDDGLLNLPTQIGEDIHLELSDNLLISLSFFFLILLPLALIVTGSLIWIRRQKS